MKLVALIYFQRIWNLLPLFLELNALQMIYLNFNYFRSSLYVSLVLNKQGYFWSACGISISNKDHFHNHSHHHPQQTFKDNLNINWLGYFWYVI